MGREILTTDEILEMLHRGSRIKPYISLLPSDLEARVSELKTTVLEPNKRHA
jgi:hypothetical protein